MCRTCYFYRRPTLVVLQFLVVVSVRYIKPTYVGFRAHVNSISYRIVLVDSDSIFTPHLAAHTNTELHIRIGLHHVPTSAAKPPDAAAVDRRDRHIGTNGRMDGRTLARFITLTAFSADRVIMHAVVPVQTVLLLLLHFLAV